jgi:methylthioribose-1-phosphate isomerase
MKLNGEQRRTIWPSADARSVRIIDQTKLPHALEIVELRTVDDAARAIKTMQVRGAPLIGATAAYGLALALRGDATDAGLVNAVAHLAEQRPTAINLKWALGIVRDGVAALPPHQRAARALDIAAEICDEDVENCRLIGMHGRELIRAIADKKRGGAVNILTHCNAGWLACVDWGTATSPIYHAHDAGIAVHVFVDETRPRNQGAALTAFELGQHGVAHTLIVDNAGGHLMQHGEVDIVITGADRVTAEGDAANKIGTYLKALAAHDNGIPFYVAMPSSTIDWTLGDGSTIPIEDRGADEVLYVHGLRENGSLGRVLIAPPNTPACNPSFDVTPARLITGLITERGVAPASRDGLLSLYPERARQRA